VQLNVGTPLANVQYQWKRDGNHVAGGNNTTLAVSEAGYYTVTMALLQRAFIFQPSHFARVLSYAIRHRHSYVPIYV
jgi:hypothetical protein